LKKRGDKSIGIGLPELIWCLMFLEGYQKHSVIL